MDGLADSADNGFAERSKAHRRIAVSATALLLGCLLAGCSTPPLQNAVGTRMVEPEAAFAYPAPGGPAISAILERKYANATQQDILLATSARNSGQNMLRVQIYGPVDTKVAGRSRLREGYLPVTNVQSEMRQLIPGVAMHTSPYYVQNKYGPFGYAAGRSASGDTCVYAWQRITSTGMTQTWIGNKGSVQVRLRLCQQGASERALLQSMYDYTITAAFQSGNWNPYGEALPPAETLGRVGNPVYPLGQERFVSVTGDPPPQQPRRRPPATAKPADPPPQPPQLPPAIGPAVPPPPGATTGGATQKGVTTVVPPPRCVTTDGSPCPL